jgi:hypothetical protein
MLPGGEQPPPNIGRDILLKKSARLPAPRAAPARPGAAPRRRRAAPRRRRAAPRRAAESGTAARAAAARLTRRAPFPVLTGQVSSLPSY